MYFIFSDVDGTLIDYDSKLLAETVSDIKKAQAKGIAFGLCTGNSHLENMTNLAKSVQARFLITSDGARVYDYDLAKIIYKQMFPKALAKVILAACKPFVYYLVWTTEEALHINIYNQEYKQHAIQTAKKYNCKSGGFNFAPAVKVAVYKISCYGAPSKLNQLERVLGKLKVTFLRHSDNFLVISPPGCNKGKAIEATAKITNVSLDNIMVVGDGLNDLSMLKVSPHAYAVANAALALKRVASHHTSSVEQNGLGEAIVDFMFRKKL